MYNDLINHPEKGLLIPPELRRFPLDAAAFSDGGIINYVAPELESVLQPLLEDAIKKREKSGEEKIENNIIGLVNLRGFIPTQYHTSGKLNEMQHLRQCSF